ncbi:MAG: hypothetical protein HYX62_07100 [Gammaproteobacteria bacterium]|nr:hypothetical protein [Gammaproteobacteria bacterium]
MYTEHGGTIVLYIDQNGLDAIKFNLTGAVFSGGSVSLLLNPKTGDVFFSGGPTVGANIGWSLVYTTDTPKEGWKWNFVIERKFLGAGGQLESSWDATEFSRTGKHKFDGDPAFGLGVGASQSATFEGTTKLFNFYTITNKIGGEFDNFNRYMDETLRSWSVRDIGSLFR